jgi:ribonuclease H-related protein
MGNKQKYYAYLTNASKGVAGSWQECEKIVSGIPNARFKGFSTQQEAQKWIEAGADYSLKHIAAEKGIYFDAGTGGGKGVEVNVTDEKGKSYIKKLLPEGATNNFGELLACKLAFEVAIVKKIMKVFGDSVLVIDYWSKGYVKKEVSAETIELAKKAKVLRKEFEKNGGCLERIAGTDNPADLGFHKG